MPVYRTTYNKPTITKAIDELLGKSFSFWQRLRQGGIGSRRMIIEEASEALLDYVDSKPYLTYSNMEIRPDGIIVHIHKKLESYAWCLPYESFEMTIQEAHLLIKTTTNSLLLRDGYKLNAAFLKKVWQRQDAYS